MMQPGMGGNYGVAEMEDPGDALDAPPPEEKAESGDQAKAAWQYSGADARCANCQHFDGEMNCNLGQFQAEPEGTCSKFSVVGGEEQAEDAAALPGGDDEGLEVMG